jgi:hypothetical protein
MNLSRCYSIKLAERLRSPDFRRWLPTLATNHSIFPGSGFVFLLAVFFADAGSAARSSAQDLPSTDSNIQQDAAALENLPAPAVLRREIPRIDSSLADWSQAGQGSAPTGNDLRANWIMLDPSGSVSGTVQGESSLDAANMKLFLLRGGFVVNQTTTSHAGNFTLAGLEAGSHTLVGYSPSAIFAFGFNAVAHRASSPNMPRRIATRAVASIGNKITVSRLIARVSPEVRFPNSGQYGFGEDAISEARHFGWQGLGRFDVAATPATTIASLPVALGNGGTLVGRVHQLHYRNGRPLPIRRTSVLLIRSGTVVAESGCDRYGVFRVAALEPGDYGLVAAGSDGFAALGIRLVGPDSDRQLPLDLTLVEAEAIGWLNHYVTEQQFCENAAQPRPVAAPRCCECGCPYFGSAADCPCQR